MPSTGEHPFATVAMAPSEIACAEFPEPLTWCDFHPYNQSEFDSSQGGSVSVLLLLSPVGRIFLKPSSRTKLLRTPTPCH